MKDMIGVCRAAALAGLVLFGLAALSGCGHKEPPNVLLITMDTTRADYIGCYGMTDVKTPFIDGVAAAGVRFAHNVAPSQCTNPSHASVMTGLYLARHAVYDNESALTTEATTLAEVLRDHGYHTLAAVSAKHLNPANSGFGQGFDRFLPCPAVTITAGKRNETFLPALAALADSGRFFAWVHYFDPHTPYEPPASYAGMYPAGANFEAVPYTKSMGSSMLRTPEGMVDPDRIIPLYKGEISYMDAQIGRVLNWLKDTGIEDNTLVIMVGDHGESMTEKGIYFCHAGMYDPVVHVPLIMRLPGVIPTGRVVESLTSSVDIFPTVLSLLGIPNDAPLSGTDLQPAFSRPTVQLHRYVFSEAVRGVIRCVYDGAFKFIKPYPRDWAMPRKHLYHTFAGDYRENEDLMEQDPQRAAEMEQILDAWVEAATAKSLPRATGHKVDPEVQKALKSLGYTH